MKLLKVRPRYEIGEKVVVEQSGYAVSRWTTVVAITVIFTEKGRDVSYSVEGRGCGRWNLVEEKRLANYEELIAALGILEAMRRTQLPKFQQWLYHLDELTVDLIKDIQKRIAEYVDANAEE
jgi:hypothetical protein